MSAKTALRRAVPTPLYRMYRSWRVPRMVTRFRPRTVTHLYGRTRLHVSLEDPLGEAWYDHDWPDLPEISFLQQHGGLETGARVFDIGAHQGVVALLLADIVGESGHVVAVEAVPHNARVAERNRRLNARPQLTIVNAAIGRHAGEAFVPAEFNARVSARSGLGLVAVPALAVDQLAAEHGSPDVVFVDVEGGELDVLRGATEVLRARRASWLVEVHVGEGLEEAGGSARAVVESFTAAGYDVFGAPATGERQPFVPVTAEHALCRRHFFAAAIPS